MSNLINLERDMFWTDASAGVAWQTTNIAANPMAVGNSGVVAQRLAFVQSLSETFTVGAYPAAGAVGALILPPPDGDSVPYRFKGSAASAERVIWGYGYRSGTTVVNVPKLVAVGPVLDECVVVRPLDVADPNYGFPLCFFCAVTRVAASYRYASLSVQRMVSKPDQYASASS